MDREVGREIEFHQVRRVAEVRATAANDLLEAGWILHDIYYSSDCDGNSTYVLLSADDPACPKCGAPAKVEMVDGGQRIRFVCTKECA